MPEGVTARGPYAKVPSRFAIRRLLKNFEETDTVSDRPKTGGVRTRRTIENINRVRQSVRKKPKMSVTHRAQTLGLLTTTTPRILKIGFKMYPYKIQYSQQLKPADHSARIKFSNWALENLKEDSGFSLRGDVECPPRFCDLTPRDFFL